MKKLNKLFLYFKFLLLLTCCTKLTDKQECVQVDLITQENLLGYYSYLFQDTLPSYYFESTKFLFVKNNTKSPIYLQLYNKYRLMSDNAVISMLSNDIDLTSDAKCFINNLSYDSLHPNESSIYAVYFPDFEISNSEFIYLHVYISHS